MAGPSAKFTSTPMSERYACPLCADTFQSAWHRDEHFDAFHIVIDATLLPHDDPAAQERPRISEPERPGISASETQLAQPETRHVPKPKQRSVYKYIYCETRRSQPVWFVQMCLRGRTFTSAHFATEAGALQAFAEEMERRRTPMSVPPLKAAPKDDDADER